MLRPHFTTTATFPVTRRVDLVSWRNVQRMTRIGPLPFPWKVPTTIPDWSLILQCMNEIDSGPSPRMNPKLPCPTTPEPNTRFKTQRWITTRPSRRASFWHSPQQGQSKSYCGSLAPSTGASNTTTSNSMRCNRQVLRLLSLDLGDPLAQQGR
jgi:hypothetical protein